MKVVAFNGSPRRKGNTLTLLKMALEALEKEGIETELVQLGGVNVRGCIACLQCMNTKDKHCAVKSDDMNMFIDKMIEADGIIIGTPTYFANVSTEVKALIDRAGLVAKANNDMFKRKVGAAVVAVRRGGSVQAFNAINEFFLIGQMIVPGSSYWNFGFGLRPAEVTEDDEGVKTMKHLGENMAWLLKKIND